MAEKHSAGNETEERSSVCNFVRSQNKEHYEEDDGEKRCRHELDDLAEFRNDVVFLHESNDAVGCTQSTCDERKEIRQFSIVREDLPTKDSEVTHHDPDF